MPDRLVYIFIYPAGRIDVTDLHYETYECPNRRRATLPDNQGDPREISLSSAHIYVVRIAIQTTDCQISYLIQRIIILIKSIITI